MSLLSLCALLLLQSHLFLICVALTYNDSRIIPHKTRQIPRIVSVKMTFSFLVGCQILYHHGISMIVTRFTFFTENFRDLQLSSHQKKKIRSGDDCTSASSARSPRYFRLQADLAIWVLRKVLVDTMLTPEPGTTFARDSIGNS